MILMRMPRTWATAATNPPADFLSRAVPVKDVAEATTLYDQLWTDFKGE